MNNAEPPQAGRSKKTTIVVITVVVIIIAIALVWWLFSEQYRSPHAAFAPPGQLISGFPKELILDQAAVFGKSYTIGYAHNLNQYTASWASSSSMNDLYNDYIQYFTSHGWTITNSSTNITEFRGIYAVTSTADANVVMDSGQAALKVTVSYVNK